MNARILAGLVLGMVSSTSFAARVTVKARCASESGQPVAGAKFEVRDQWIKYDRDKVTGALDKGDDFVKKIRLLTQEQNVLLKSGFTDSNGRFEVTVDHGDWGFPGDIKNKPDIYVRCLLESADEGSVTPVPVLKAPYDVVSDTRIDDDSSPQGHGELRFPDKRVKVFDIMRSVVTKIRATTGLRQRAVVAYPFGMPRAGNAKDITGFAGLVFVAMGEAQVAHWYLAHELGHGIHLLGAMLADLGDSAKLVTLFNRFWERRKDIHTFPARIADHDYERKTSQEIAFFDGWASFISAIVAGFRDEGGDFTPPLGYETDQARMPNCETLLKDYEWSSSIKNKKKGEDVAIGGEADRIQVEAIVGCRLWRLNRRYGFAPIWETMKEKKPLTWNEFMELFRQKRPGSDEVAVPRQPIITSECGTSSRVSAGRFRWGDNGDVFHSNGSAYCFHGRQLAWIYWKGHAAKYREGYLGLRSERCGAWGMTYHGICQGFVRKRGEPADPYQIPARRGTYSWHPAWKLSNVGRGALLFKTNAKNDIHIAFANRAENRTPMYEIVVGGWGNTKSVCRRRAQGDQFGEAAVGIPGVSGGRGLVMNQLRTQDVWVGVDNIRKKIQVGFGTVVGVGTVLECSDADFLSDVHYFSLSSWDTPIRYSEIRTVDLP